MLTDLVPDSVDVDYLIGQEQLICEALHDVRDLLIAGSHKYSAPLFDLILTLAKVVVELIDEFVTFMESCNMPLSAAILLSFDHDSTLVRLDHLHLESLTLDLGFVDL